LKSKEEKRLRENESEVDLSQQESKRGKVRWLTMREKK